MVGRKRRETISAFGRLEQFPGTGLVVKDKTLFCSRCKKTVDFTRKHVVQTHIQSQMHQSWTEAANNNVTLVTPDASKYSLDKQWLEMTSSFVSCGLPLHVFRNGQLRSWLKKYLKNGEKLPSESTLRRCIEPEAAKDISQTIEICSGKDVCLIMDETSDPRNRKVLNILVAPLEPNVKPRLLSSSIIEKCDKKAIVEAATSAIKKDLLLELDNLVVLISDNAPYMIAAGEALSAICPRLMHSTCWSHILHLAAEEVRCNMPLADKLISIVKRALIKAPARRNEYFSSCEKMKKPSTLPPVPVLSRWATWLEAGHFNFEYWTVIDDWRKNNGEKTGYMKTLKLIFEDTNVEQTAQELERIHEVYPGISSSLKLLEQTNLVASEVWGILKLINSYMSFLGIPSQKLNLYLNEKHPALNFWKDVQVLDSRKCPENILSGLPESLHRFSKERVPLHELMQYRTLSSIENELNVKCEPFSFWKKYSNEMPILSKLAIQALSVFSSSAEVERSFSYLTKLLSPQRLSLTEKSLDAHLRIIFNTKQVTEVTVGENSDEE